MKKSSLNNYKRKFKKLRNTGFFSIFLSNILSKIIIFFGGIIIVRILSKTDYGIYAYILNCISILYLLNDFGASNAALQYLTENQENKEKQMAILKFSIKMGITASIASSILILLSPFFFPFTISKAKLLTPILFGIPIITSINTLIPVILRANLENKKYALLQIISTISSYILLITLSFVFGLIGAVLSQYFYNLIILIFGVYLVKQFFKKNRTEKKTELTKIEKKQFISFALFTQLNNTIGGLLLVCDTFLIGLLIAKAEVVALYKVASAIPNALAFIPASVVIYVLPYFIKNNKNRKWLQKSFKYMIFWGVIGYGVISLGLILSSRLIFKILFGKQYLDAILPFTILVIGFFFSSAFKIPCSNITYSLRKVKINIIVNVIALIINIISNIVFIKLFGYIGVAITTTIINIITSIIYLIYVNNLLKKETVFNLTEVIE